MGGWVSERASGRGSRVSGWMDLECGWSGGQLKWTAAWMDG